MAASGVSYESDYKLHPSVVFNGCKKLDKSLIHLRALRNVTRKHLYTIVSFAENKMREEGIIPDDFKIRTLGRCEGGFMYIDSGRGLCPKKYMKIREYGCYVPTWDYWFEFDFSRRETRDPVREEREKLRVPTEYKRWGGHYRKSDKYCDFPGKCGGLHFDEWKDDDSIVFPNGCEFSLRCIVDGGSNGFTHTELFIWEEAFTRFYDEFKTYNVFRPDKGEATQFFTSDIDDMQNESVSRIPGKFNYPNTDPYDVDVARYLRRYDECVRELKCSSKELTPEDKYLLENETEIREYLYELMEEEPDYETKFENCYDTLSSLKTEYTTMAISRKRYREDAVTYKYFYDKSEEEKEALEEEKEALKRELAELKALVKKPVE